MNVFVLFLEEKQNDDTAHIQTQKNNIYIGTHKQTQQSTTI